MEELVGYMILSSPLACIILCIYAEHERKKIKQQIINNREKRNRYKKKHNLLSAIQYIYTNNNIGIETEYIINKKNKTLLVSDTSDNYITIPFDEITDCAIVINNKTFGSISRAIAGGILAGGAGAIIGTITNTPKINSYQIIIYRNNLEFPSFVFNLIVNSKQNAYVNDDTDIENANIFAQNIKASIQAIITSQSNIKNNNSDIEQRLKELETLKDSRIISEKEYTNRRNKILKEL